MSNTIETLFDYTTDFENLTETDIENAKETLFLDPSIEEGQFPVFIVQVILPHGEHADLDKIYKFIVPGKNGIFTADTQQAEWSSDLEKVVNTAAELVSDFERVRIVYTLQEN